MHKGLVRFPAVGTFIITLPSNKELHYRSLMMITTMSDDLVNYELLFVLLSNINWIDTMRIKTKGRRLWMCVLIVLPLIKSSMMYIDCSCPITWYGPLCLESNLLLRPIGGVQDIWVDRILGDFSSFSTRWYWSDRCWFSWAAIKSVCCLDIHSSILSDSDVSVESTVLSIGEKMWDDRRSDPSWSLFQCVHDTLNKWKLLKWPLIVDTAIKE